MSLSLHRSCRASLPLSISNPWKGASHGLDLIGSFCCSSFEKKCALETADCSCRAVAREAPIGIIAVRCQPNESGRSDCGTALHAERREGTRSTKESEGGQRLNRNCQVTQPNQSDAREVCVTAAWKDFRHRVIALLTYRSAVCRLRGTVAYHGQREDRSRQISR